MPRLPHAPHQSINAKMYHLLALITICIWGTTFVSTKVLLGCGLTPSEIFIVRFLLAYVGMAAISHQRWRLHTWREEGIALLAGLTGGSLYFLAENTALEMAPAGYVSFIVCLAPVFTVPLSALRRERDCTFTPHLWAGMALALMGVFFIAWGDMDGQSSLSGILLALAAALLWAVYQNVVGPLTQRYGTALLTRKVFGYGLLSMLVLYPLTDTAHRGPEHLFHLLQTVPLSADGLTVWGNLLFLGLIASLACYVTWNVVVEKLGAVISANYIYLNPLTTCLFSALILGETFSLTAALGCVAILGGVIWAVKCGVVKVSGKEGAGRKHPDSV